MNKKSLCIFLFLSLFLCGTSLAQSPEKLPVQMSIHGIHRELSSEISHLKDRQDIVLESVSNSFNRAVGLLGILGAVITVLTILQYRRDERIIRSQEKQIEDAKELGKSYKENISSITGLVQAMEGALKLFSQAQEMVGTVETLQQEFKKGENHWQEEISKLNEAAMFLSPKCKRNSHNIPEIQRLVSDFFDNYRDVKSSVKLQGQINANCHFILSFHERIRGNYDDAISQLKEAIKLSEEHKATIEKYVHLYPKLPTGTTVEIWLTKLQNICFYHLAIMVYNLGQYQEALQFFNSALEYDPLDYKALTYIPEVMFLGHLASFDKIIKEFESIATKIKSLEPENTNSFSESKDDLLAQVYLKLGNCYMQDAKDSEFSSFRDIKKAEGFVSKAYHLNPNSLVIKFTLAQILYLCDKEEKRRQELFTKVFHELKSKMGRITEIKILVMNYYILAISCAYGNIISELPQIYTMRIYEIAHHLPKTDILRVFSPLTKRDLTVGNYLTEVQNFERELLSTKDRPLNSVRRSSYRKIGEGR